MAVYKIIKLRFLSPTHIGTGKENYDFSSGNLSADTISAALVAMRVQCGNRESIQDFLASFRISSAFPYSGSRLFLPKIANRVNAVVSGKKEYEYRKKLKKIAYIELPLWEKFCTGMTEEISEAQIKGSFLINDEGEHFEMPYMNEVMQRVAVPRFDGKDASPFYFDWRYYSPNSGLYCIIDASDNVFEELKKLFSMLGEIGIGTDKNIGGGKFIADVGTIELPEIPSPNATLLLSTYLPSEAELGQLSLSTASYLLILRGGYMAGSEQETMRHLCKQSVYMFDAGSLFLSRLHLEGKIVDLKPAWNAEGMHPVYRSGRPFYLPIKI